MDVDTLNSPTEEQMEMMIMMMQMDKKLPSEFSPPHPDSITHHSFHSPHLISPSQTLLNPPPHPLSFLSYNTIHHTHHLLLQEPILPPSTTLSTSPAMADENKLTHHNNISSDHFSSATTAFPSYPLSNNKRTSMASMREMIFGIAAMQPIHIDPESIKPPKRRNVKISKDPLSVAARHRREKISERIRILQRLVPRGTKMDTASLLDEAIHYVKFLKTQVQSLERASANSNTTSIGLTSSINGFTAGICNADFGSLEKTYNYFPAHHQMFSSTQMLN